MKSSTRFSIISLIFAAVTFSATARDIDQDEALRLRQQGEIMAFESVLALVMERYPGARLLGAELEEDDDEYIYEIELVTRERVVRDLEVDARTGKILEDEEDD